MDINTKYLPKNLTKKNYRLQKKYIEKSRKMYKKGKYYVRPSISDFKSKPSKHVKNAQKLYNIDKITPSKELSRKTRCSVKALKKIVNKGRGAYYSSGSRPNQTPESWGRARLASAITGSNASIVDYDILRDGCKSNSIALKLANKKII